MRFLHQDFSPIAAWLDQVRPTIHRLEWDREPIASGFPMLSFTLKRRPARPPATTTVAEIRATFDLGSVPEKAGTVLRNYFHLNRPPSEVSVSLSRAVEHVEAFGAPEELLLVGYPDGGLISVSRSPLPFQADAKEATWWGP